MPIVKMSVEIVGRGYYFFSDRGFVMKTHYVIE